MPILIVFCLILSSFVLCLRGQAPTSTVTKTLEPARMLPAPEPARIQAVEESWQEKCRERFNTARTTLMASGEPGAAALWSASAITTADHPGGAGGVWLRLDLNGVRYGAGVSGVQEGNIPDTDWYSLNGATAAPGRVSLWTDRDARSGFIGGLDEDDARRDEFTRRMRAAVDDCLRMK